MSFPDQSRFDVRCEWGLPALEHLAPADVVVIVDVLSFTTSVEIATGRGALVFPYQWKDDTAIAYAKEKQAELASVRDRFEGKFSLSPSSLLAVPSSLRMVLPSPNGSTLAFRAKSLGSVVIAGSLRNATLLGRWLNASAKTIAVIPAGERWPDRSLRHAAEDLIGAGAILKNLRGSLSPEARLAVAAFEEAQKDLPGFLLQSTSGRELEERGFRRDVELAAELDAGASLPVLQEDCFRNLPNPTLNP